MIFVVLGMHKSGTTMVSQMLHHSGVHMGNFDLSKGYDQQNYYEHQEVVALNDWIMGTKGVMSIDIKVPEVFELSDEQEIQIKALISHNMDSHENWGFKDPRTCLTYSLWKQLLPKHSLIIVYRDPVESWRRYGFTRRLDRLRRPYLAWKYLNRWYESNVSILEILENTTLPFLVIKYSEMMKDDREFLRLQGFVGRELLDSRRKDLYRGRTGERELELWLGLADFFMKIKHGQTTKQVLLRLDQLRG